MRNLPFFSSIVNDLKYHEIRYPYFVQQAHPAISTAMATKKTIAKPKYASGTDPARWSETYNIS